MRRTVTNNCRTKIFFNPAGSEDVSQITGMLQGIDKNQLQALGKYRAAIQKPSEKDRQKAVIFNTYPPWQTDHNQVEQVKKR